MKGPKMFNLLLVEQDCNDRAVTMDHIERCFKSIEVFEVDSSLKAMEILNLSKDFNLIISGCLDLIHFCEQSLIKVPIVAYCEADISPELFYNASSRCLGVAQKPDIDMLEFYMFKALF